MTGTIYSIDTPALYWYEFDLPPLSPAARDAFAEAEQGLAELVLHPLVLAEFYYLLRKQGREVDFLAYLGSIEHNPLYRVEPIVLDDFRRLPDYPEIPEMHHRLIAIQAHRLGAVLVSRDESVRASAQVRWIW